MWVIRNKPRDHQKAATGFLDANPLLLNFLRQEWSGELQFVLHLNLRDIGVGTGLEGQRDGDAPRGIAGGGHIHQVIDPVHILFDNLRNRILYRLCIRTWVGGGNGDRRRCNSRVLRHGQLHDCQSARHHQNDGQYPGKDRTPDKKVSHVRLPYWAFVAGVSVSAVALT